jgi:hypothetical protein
VSVDADHLGRSASFLADVGRMVERAAHALGPASSAMGRVTAAVSVARLGARLVPAGGRLIRRYPAGSVLVLAGVLGALYLARAPREPSRRRSGRLEAARSQRAASSAPRVDSAG